MYGPEYFVQRGGSFCVHVPRRGSSFCSTCRDGAVVLPERDGSVCFDVPGRGGVFFFHVPGRAGPVVFFVSGGRDGGTGRLFYFFVGMG